MTCQISPVTRACLKSSSTGAASQSKRSFAHLSLFNLSSDSSYEVATFTDFHQTVGVPSLPQVHPSAPAAPQCGPIAEFLAEFHVNDVYAHIRHKPPSPSPSHHSPLQGPHEVAIRCFDHSGEYSTHFRISGISQFDFFCYLTYLY
jgi:hypothetical protein